MVTLILCKKVAPDGGIKENHTLKLSLLGSKFNPETRNETLVLLIVNWLFKSNKINPCSFSFSGMTDPSAESLLLGPGVTPMSAAQGPQGGPPETGGERRRIKRQKIKVRKDSGFSLYSTTRELPGVALVNILNG